MAINKISLFALSFIVIFSGLARAETIVPLHDVQNKVVGSVSITQTKKGLLIRLEAQGLPSGWHGFHVHAIGDCSDHAAHFKKSGGHYSRAGEAHGYLNDEGPHAGDLPNIWVDDDGMTKVEFYMDSLKMGELADANGSAFMIHAKPDDYTSQPAGEAGERLACGAMKTE